MYLSRTRLGDHYRYHEQYEKAGIHVFKPFDYIDGIRISEAYSDNFKVYSFELPHGETKSYGFYITHPELGKLLFLTDFEYCPFSFKDMKVNHIMIEANYQNDLLDMDSVNFEHKVRGHCSLDTACSFIEHNNSPELRTVTLIHSNPTTLDEKGAVERIRTLVDDDVIVGVCHPGYEIELKKEVF